MFFFSYFSSQGFANCYLIGPKAGKEAILIDPGIFDVDLLKIIEDHNLYIKHILITHSHEDHTSAIKTILKIYDANIYGYRQSISGFPAVKLRDYEKLNLGAYHFEVLETPGHSGDSLTYRLENMLFTGDTLLAGSIGYTVDAFSRGLIITSLKEKVFTLPDETFIFPGHGPPSKVGIERYLNLDLNEDI